MSKGPASDDDETDFSAMSAWDTHNETKAYGTPVRGPDDNDGADPWSASANQTQRYAPPAAMTSPALTPRSVRAQLEADGAVADDWGAGVNRTQAYASPAPPTSPPSSSPSGPAPHPADPRPDPRPTQAIQARLIEWVLAPPAGVEREVPARLSSLKSLKPSASPGRAFQLAPPAGVDDA